MSTQNPDELREEVRRTREDLADTVDELASRLDVKARAHEAADDAKDAVRESLLDPDGRPRPETYVLVGGLAALVAAALVLRSLRRDR